LEKLPKGTDALDQAYEEAMQRIQSQESGFHELAKRVLSWITCARRPLTTLELQHALAVETGDSELGNDNLQEIDEVISVCAGLVTIDEESDVVRLVHYTTQEYFERTQTSWFPNAQNDIAATCVTYLSFDAFEAGFCPTDEKFEERLRLNVFYDYAARNWGHHARAASTEVEQLILNLLENEAKVSGSSQAMMASGSYFNYGQRAPKQMTGIHLAAYFGLREAMIGLLKNGHHPDSKDTYGRTPLLWAAANGHEAVVKLLVEKGAELECKDKNYGQTPLSWAAANGHEAVVKLLVEKGAELECKDKYGRTPLSWVAANGHEAVVKLLVEKGAELECKDNYGQTPLSLAAANGHEAVVKLLVEKGAELECKDKIYGRTPLLWAAANGHEAVVKLLVEKGAELECKDKIYGRTPLSWAAENGHEAVVKLLVEKGAELECKEKNFGRTPLSWAAENGHEAVVKLLVEKGAELECKDKNGRTPLSWAAGNGHEAVVKLLVEKGAKLESNDYWGRTPLSWAARSGHETVVKLLQQQGGLPS
jgi:ankyrin repeat protein